MQQLIQLKHDLGRGDPREARTYHAHDAQGDDDAKQGDLVVEEAVLEHRHQACLAHPDVPELTHDERKVPRRLRLPVNHHLLFAVDVRVARQGRRAQCGPFGLMAMVQNMRSTEQNG